MMLAGHFQFNTPKKQRKTIRVFRIISLNTTGWFTLTVNKGGKGLGSFIESSKDEFVSE